MIIACDSGDKKAPNFVIGSVWAPTERAFLDFEAATLQNIRIKHKCWSGLQWKKSITSSAIISTYNDFISLFLGKNIFFSCIIVNQETLKNFGEYMGKDIRESEAGFIYLLITRRARIYCKDNKNLFQILLHQEQRPRDEITFIRDNIRQRINADPDLKQIAYLEHIQECNSHICSLIQLCDILVGAVSHRINSTHTSATKKKIAKKLEKELYISLNERTPFRFKKFNIWFWKPS